MDEGGEPLRAAFSKFVATSVGMGWDTHPPPLQVKMRLLQRREVSSWGHSKVINKAGPEPGVLIPTHCRGLFPPPHPHPTPVSVFLSPSPPFLLSSSLSAMDGIVNPLEFLIHNPNPPCDFIWRGGL